MPETPLYKPIETTKGPLDNIECYRFGNGVIMEKIVYAKATFESSTITDKGKRERKLPLKDRDFIAGTDVVQIHFTPKTSRAESATQPYEVAPEERYAIAIDCLEGMISLAQHLQNNQLTIHNHLPEDDFYLYADTHASFAAFLRLRCGFRSSIPGTKAWIRKSAFSSNENIARMMAHRDEFFKEKSSSSQKPSVAKS